ncbi:hypothetical protein K466DRAFT_602582 [Polyporus arcularius HHB13444]|uniref:Uncharacterized protein n=1 Tax=Polyporus arcularius HHB13444 TaxID=1314778 RepID=A0A5C3P3B8_9APHY|nr:hypothetical protein K466DRAFT_602582 [Polyporus arcularius HHB13444]
MNPAPDALIRAFMLHRLFYHDDSGSDDEETSGHDAATKAMINIAIFASQVAYKLTTTKGAERADAYARATESFKTRVLRTHKALRRGMLADTSKGDAPDWEDEDTGDGGDREDAMSADESSEEYARHGDGLGAQDTMIFEDTADGLIDLQATIMGERVVDKFVEKMESALVPGLKLRVDAHVDEHVLPGLANHVNAHIDTKISDLEEHVNRRVDSRINERLKEILLSDTQSFRDALCAIFPQLAASTHAAAVIPLSTAATLPTEEVAAEVCAPERPVESSVAAPTVKREPYSPHQIVGITKSGLVRRVKPRTA